MSRKAVLQDTAYLPVFKQSSWLLVIDVDNTHSSKWSLQGPVDISLSWRALFTKKAKRLKDIRRSPHWQSCFYRGRENSGLRGDTKASSQVCVRKQNSSGQSVTPGAFCHSVWWHWTVCPTTYREEWGEVKYCLTSKDIVDLWIFYGVFSRRLCNYTSHWLAYCTTVDW